MPVQTRASRANAGNNQLKNIIYNRPRSPTHPSATRSTTSYPNLGPPEPEAALPAKAVPPTVLPPHLEVQQNEDGPYRGRRVLSPPRADSIAKGDGGGTRVTRSHTPPNKGSSSPRRRGRRESPQRKASRRREASQRDASQMEASTSFSVPVITPSNSGPSAAALPNLLHATSHPLVLLPGAASAPDAAVSSSGEATTSASSSGASISTEPAPVFGPKEKPAVANNYDVGYRISIMCYVEAGFAGGDKKAIAKKFSCSPSQIYAWAKIAKERGHITGQPFLVEHLQDAPRKGRPRVVNEASSKVVLDAVSKDHDGRFSSLPELAKAAGISASSVGRILKANNYRKVKPTYKPGLTDKMRAARMDFCRKYKDWTLEDWKNVIWTDETSVILGSRRGKSEFMWWSCFSWDKKGPYHIWKPETANERKASVTAIAEMNVALEPILRDEWETNSMLRRQLMATSRGKGRAHGKEPVWNFNKKNGKLTRGSGKGIDWWRYQRCILYPKLIPFALECMKERPDTVVMEDGAPAHAHHAQHKVFSLLKVLRLLWPGNSPDLNAIEPCWFWMKRETTKHGCWSNKKKCEAEWIRVWNAMPQEKIQAWITRIFHHVQRVFELEGGNEYKEGTTACQRHKPRPVIDTLVDTVGLASMTVLTESGEVQVLEDEQSEIWLDIEDFASP